MPIPWSWRMKKAAKGGEEGRGDEETMPTLNFSVNSWYSL